jgi:hypothetical protein
MDLCTVHPKTLAQRFAFPQPTADTGRTQCVMLTAGKKLVKAALSLSIRIPFLTLTQGKSVSDTECN